MKAARLHEYGKPLVLEDIPVPDIAEDEVLVQVKACGMCRSDVQLIDGYFRPYADLKPPLTLGHEIAGVIAKAGSLVPKGAGIAEGDHVVVAPGWGDGVCRHCQVGDTQICPNVRWPGFGPVGGFAEFIPVPVRYVIKVAEKLPFEQLAPLTDAGLTTYRGIRKLRDAGALGPDRVIGVLGVGGLGAYAVQYARLLGGGARVVALARSEDKLKVAREYGVDHTIAVKDTSEADVRKELHRTFGQGELDAIIDCTGAPAMIQLGMSLLATSGHYVDVGLVGDRIDIPLFPRVSREQSFHGSFWGNNADLMEVMALAAQDKIRHTIKTISFDELNQYIDLLRGGDIVGRAVMTF
ncbi:alcohol dehydrogenase, propanol-preferring [Luteibacter sp. UNCMF331Sha3.1]|uniref:NAD(P)-dependent alcohol dehydrogenase n=1 Tax=Luteibacter sp. UNCMF331Sha3.1 TaxID=1502760 RepID=UPI0008B09027|nr:NAD(P)-dependent alcohol dehydrogenase [Luteibacter sp. UNCMF331Sha3.1]SEN20306.1 alcohol dehydrogenase, propanol-preferring [Luteibacter sp. UNCMF331Sha3.1]